MISIEKLKILTPLQKLPKNVRDLGKLIVAKGFKKLPKVQKIARSGHTGPYPFLAVQLLNVLLDIWRVSWWADLCLGRLTIHNWFRPPLARLAYFCRLASWVGHHHHQNQSTWICKCHLALIRFSSLRLSLPKMVRHVDSFQIAPSFIHKHARTSRHSSSCVRVCIII